jgi:hypothetical protein
MGPITRFSRIFTGWTGHAKAPVGTSRALGPRTYRGACSFLRLQPQLDQPADGFGSCRGVIFRRPFVDGCHDLFGNAARYRGIAAGGGTATPSFLDFRY